MRYNYIDMYGYAERFIIGGIPIPIYNLHVVPPQAIFYIYTFTDLYKMMVCKNPGEIKYNYEEIENVENHNVLSLYLSYCNPVKVKLLSLNKYQFKKTECIKYISS